MRICKIDNHAYNGVRIVLNSKFILLVALAFLCLSIVSLCVFSNLNALATDNIAFADVENVEPVRYVGSDGMIAPNMIRQNWIAFNTSYLTANVTANGTDILIYQDEKNRCYLSGYGSLSNGVLTASPNGTVSVKWYFVDYLSYPTSTRFNGGCGWSSASGGVSCYIYLGGMRNFSTQGTNCIYGYYNSNATLDSGSHYAVSVTNSVSVTLSWVACYNQQGQFAGYISPDYQYYGYNQGYADGVASGGGSSDPIFPIDNGFVGTNLMPNSYCLGYTYDSHINTTSDRYYSDVNWVYTYGYGTGQYSLVNNVLTNVNANYVSLKYEGSLPSGDYIFTLGFTSSYSYDVEVDVYNSNTHDDYGEHVEKYENEAPYWISSAFTIPNSNMRSSGTPVTIDVICFLDNNTSINLNFIKLETGSVFTGYALDLNGDYQEGYEDGLAEGYTEGFDDGVTQATVTFDYSVWSSTVNTSSGLVANIDQPEFNPNTYDNSAVFIRIYSVDNQAHTYSDPVSCAFYMTFDNALSSGFVIYIDFTFNVDFTGTQKIGYVFAPLGTSYDCDEAWANRDGVFDNNTSGIMLVVPRTSNRIYFSFGVTETKGVSGAGGLPLYYLYSFSVSDSTGYHILANSVSPDSDVVKSAYDQGKEDGFLLGQIDGQQNSPYSFKALFSSIYDVPVGAFNNMFNFDVFGVNFRTFLLAMISLALGLFIWKVIVRGG